MLCSRIVRHRQHVIFEAILDQPWPSPQWNTDERLMILGPDNVGEMTPELRRFLGGDEAHENIESIRKGNRLFVISQAGRFVHCGYVLFHARGATLIGELDRPPLIACCLTAAGARGRGLYRKALHAELQYLQQQGYRRVVIETDPENMASRRGIEGAGFRFCRLASTWTVLNIVALRRTIGSGKNKWNVCLL
jgi:RimJ/RimL family protein N-acetyltransferase